jgi:uncharacterized protein (TIGR03118 family)
MILIVAALIPMVLQRTVGAVASGVNNSYRQTNLVSDINGIAAFTDPNLINPWGIAFSPTGAFWVADNGTGFSTVYNGKGQPVPPKSPLVVSIPPASGSGPGSPTGTVFNGTTGFVISQGTASGPAAFLFGAEDGTISGWNPAVSPTSAIIAVNNSASAVYFGLALASNNDGTFLYAANGLESTAHPNGTIDVFNQNFAPASLQGSFTDPHLPAGYAPYNIQAIGGSLVVAYFLESNSPPQVGQGFVDVFDTQGNLIRRLISHGPLDAPWGLVRAPGNFGQFSHALLVGNVSNGLINAFDFKTGNFLGTLKDEGGHPIQNGGLWALTFGNGGMGGDQHTLYFAAGIGDYGHGLFGAITLDSHN